jgi:hypothetical protein
MGYKKLILEYIIPTREQLATNSLAYNKIGRNPYEVIYDEHKHGTSLEHLDKYINLITESQEDDVVCSINTTKQIREEIDEAVEKRTELTDKIAAGELDEADETVIKEMAGLNGLIATCNDLLVISSYLLSLEAKNSNKEE